MNPRIESQQRASRRYAGSLPLTFAAVALGVAPYVAAKVPVDAAAKLGNELTPVGAEKAGNSDGVIPAWAGGQSASGSLKDSWPHDDAIDGDQPLFTITHDNFAQYAGRLTEGHKELLKRFADYRMIVYPTRRVVSWPGAIYDSSKANATTCELKGSDLPDNCRMGFPFPIPVAGAEVIWNHRVRWRGEAVRRYNNQLIVQPGGDYQLTKLIEDVKFNYGSIRSPGTLNGKPSDILAYISQTVAPPRLAGQVILVRDRTGTGDEGRAAWIYNPGLKRIRRAPTVQYDNPYDGTDGNEFYDQVDMFNGALDRFDWAIIGKKELYLPYNDNRIAGNRIKYADMVRPHHLNQDLVRYELHRYWIIQASLKPGTSHIFKTRRFYVDEDSWDIEAVDAYDNKDQLYKFQEGHLIFARNAQFATTVPEVIYDFFSGRYFVTAAFNEDQPPDLTVNFADDYFSPGWVQKITTK